MNKRERQQLEIKLRNRLAELDAEMDGFRAHHRVLQRSDEDFADGKIAREELDLIAKLLVNFARSAMTAAASVSSSRAAFEIAQNAAHQIKGRLVPDISLMAKHLNRLQPDKKNAEANRRAIDNAERALAQMDVIVAEAEFNFAARKVRSGKAPSNDLIDSWIALWPDDDGDIAWEEIRNLFEFQTLSRELFRERWKHVRDNPKRGRPPSKLRSTL